MYFIKIATLISIPCKLYLQPNGESVEEKESHSYLRSSEIVLNKVICRFSLSSLRCGFGSCCKILVKLEVPEEKSRKILGAFGPLYCQGSFAYYPFQCFKQRRFHLCPHKAVLQSLNYFICHYLQLDVESQINLE